MLQYVCGSVWLVRGRCRRFEFTPITPPWDFHPAKESVDHFSLTGFPKKTPMRRKIAEKEHGQGKCRKNVYLSDLWMKNKSLQMYNPHHWWEVILGAAHTHGQEPHTHTHDLNTRGQTRLLSHLEPNQGVSQLLPGPGRETHHPNMPPRSPHLPQNKGTRKRRHSFITVTVQRCNCVPGQ